MQFITWNIIIFNDSVEIQLSIVQDEVSESDLEGTGVSDVLKFKAVLTEHEGSSFSSVLTIHLAPDNTIVSCESEEHKVIRYIGMLHNITPLHFQMCIILCIRTTNHKCIYSKCRMYAKMHIN